jgi:hypothetical protein
MRRTSRLVALLLALLGLVGGSATAVTAQEMGSPTLLGLIAQYPSSIAGSPLEVITFSGDEWLAGQDPTQRDAFLAYLGNLGVGGPEATPEAVAAAATSDVALASGVFVNSLGASTSLTAIAVCPAAASDLVRGTLGLYGTTVEDTSEVATSAGDSVLTGVARIEETGMQIRALAKSNVVWLVDAGEPALPEIMAVIPAASVPCI